MPGVLVWIAANGNDSQPGMLEHLFEVGVSRNVAAVLGAEFGVVEFARGIDGGDLGVWAGIDGGDVRGGRDPAHSRSIPTLYFLP